METIFYPQSFKTASPSNQVYLLQIIMFEREASKGLQQEIDTLSEAIRKLQGNIQQLTISKEAVRYS